MELYEGVRAVSRLEAMGLKMSLLLEALRLACNDAAACTPLDPPGNRGHVRWASAVRFLRMLLLPEGWTYENHACGGLATVVHPSGAFQIAVVTGNADTGSTVPGIMPATKYSRGASSHEAIEVNSGQGDLFTRVNISTGLKKPGMDSPGGCQTLFLLVHEKGETLISELSRPTVIGEHGRATEFVERIILDPLELGTPPPMHRFDAGDDDVDVVVTRK